MGMIFGGWGGGVILFVVLICALAAEASEGKRKLLGAFLDNGNGCSPLQNDQDAMEEGWIQCKTELMDKADFIGDFDMDALQEATTEVKAALLTKQSIDKAIKTLPSSMKQLILDCLKKKNLHIRLFAKEISSKKWSINGVEFLFYRPSTQRRNLVTESPQGRASRFDPPFAFAQVKKTEIPSQKPRSMRALAQSPNQKLPSSPAPSPHPYMKKPHHSPAPALAPARSPSRKVHPPIKSPSTQPRPVHKHRSRPASHALPPQPSKKRHDNQNQDNSWIKIAIAVAITAVVTFMVAALVFFCCLSGSTKKVGPRDVQKDDRPLLNLSLSDFSAGSSRSHSIGNSSNKEFNSHSSKTMVNVGALSLKHDPSMPEGSQLEAASSIPLPPLTPPPRKSAPPPPGPPPAPPPCHEPPPPPKVTRPPPAPPARAGNLPPFGPRGRSGSNLSDDSNGDSDSHKAKLKPFFWDKVLASPDRAMVWHEIKAGSFQFNEEKMESLFGYNKGDKNKADRRKDSSMESTQYVQIVDTKKAQNISILLRALNLTNEEVSDALKQGDHLPVELLQTLLKMAPTNDEELKLRLYIGDISQLGPAERFLKILIEIPFAFKRLEALLFMSIAQEEVSSVKESIMVLEVACIKLRSSRLFLKLLEAVLKTGNRMNDGTYRGGAQAFKLDTLLKLSDVRGVDGKTTLLHFVVQEIIRSEGIKAARAAQENGSISSVKSEDSSEESYHESAEHYRTLGLRVVSGLSNELEDVKKAAIIDADSISASVAKLQSSVEKNRKFLNCELKSLEEDHEFCQKLSRFLDNTEAEIASLSEEEKRIMSLVENTANYFHGDAGKSEGLRLFVIVRDFLTMLDKACKDLREAANANRTAKRERPVSSSPQENRQQNPDIRQRLFPAIVERQTYSSDSDDESSSP